MFVLYLLWITLIVGGGWLGVGAILEMSRGGFDIALLLMAIMYCGCALYSVPKLLKLILTPPAHGR